MKTKDSKSWKSLQTFEEFLEVSCDDQQSSCERTHMKINDDWALCIRKKSRNSLTHLHNDIIPPFFWTRISGTDLRCASCWIKVKIEGLPWWVQAGLEFRQD